MEEKIKTKIDALKKEQAKGESELGNLSKQIRDVEECVMRIKGAIIALEDLVKENKPVQE